jgi:hypothetical protein
MSQTHRGHLEFGASQGIYLRRTNRVATKTGRERTGRFGACAEGDPPLLWPSVIDRFDPTRTSQDRAADPESSHSPKRAVSGFAPLAVDPRRRKRSQKRTSALGAEFKTPADPSRSSAT